MLLRSELIKPRRTHLSGDSRIKVSESVQVRTVAVESPFRPRETSFQPIFRTRLLAGINFPSGDELETESKRFWTMSFLDYGLK